MAKGINCDDIQEGMILAQPILNKFGQVLLPANVELQKKHSHLLKTWGITVVFIKNEESTNQEIEISEEMKLHIREHLNTIILWEPQLPFEKEIYQLAFTNEAKKRLQSAS